MNSLSDLASRYNLQPPRQPQKLIKTGMTTTCMQYRHHRLREDSDHTITSARLRRLWRRHHEYHACHATRTPSNCSQGLVSNMQREARALGATCDPCDPQSINTFRAWIDDELAARENEQKNARVNNWRSKMKHSTGEVFRWLARDRVTMPTHSLTHNGRPLTGDALHAHVASFWKSIWPPTDLEAQRHRQQQIDYLAHAANPWPVNSESPNLLPLTAEDFRKTFHKMKRKAVGPD